MKPHKPTDLNFMLPNSPPRMDQEGMNGEPQIGANQEEDDYFNYEFVDGDEFGYSEDFPGVEQSRLSDNTLIKLGSNSSTILISSGQWV